MNEISSKERTLPVVVRNINGNVYALFFTLPAREGHVMCYNIHKGWHELHNNSIHGASRVPYAYRMQLFAILHNLGKHNLKYYDSTRKWFARDRRVAEQLLALEQSENYKRTNQGS